MKQLFICSWEYAPSNSDTSRVLDIWCMVQEKWYTGCCDMLRNNLGCGLWCFVLGYNSGQFIVFPFLLFLFSVLAAYLTQCIAVLCSKEYYSKAVLLPVSNSWKLCSVQDLRMPSVISTSRTAASDTLCAQTNMPHCFALSLFPSNRVIRLAAGPISSLSPLSLGLSSSLKFLAHSGYNYLTSKSFCSRSTLWSRARHALCRQPYTHNRCPVHVLKFNN
jgi:hypothetical protein